MEDYLNLYFFSSIGIDIFVINYTKRAVTRNYSRRSIAPMNSENKITITEPKYLDL